MWPSLSSKYFETGQGYTYQKSRTNTTEDAVHQSARETRGRGDNRYPAFDIQNFWGPELCRLALPAQTLTRPVEREGGYEMFQMRSNSRKTRGRGCKVSGYHAVPRLGGGRSHLLTSVPIR